MITILLVAILIVSIIVHEVCHGFMADFLGDPTARLEGRLTLNPISHIDPVGSIIVPIVTSMMGFTFGWAKPVPYNPYNLKNRRQGEFLIALAGPLSNLFIALVFGLIIRFSLGSVPIAFIQVCTYIVFVNITLAVFNLIPVPPLDGSKLFLAFLPNQYGKIRMALETFGPILVFVVVFFVWEIFAPVIPWIYQLITGVGI